MRRLEGPHRHPEDPVTEGDVVGFGPQFDRGGRLGSGLERGHGAVGSIRHPHGTFRQGEAGRRVPHVDRLNDGAGVGVDVRHGAVQEVRDPDPLGSGGDRPWTVAHRNGLHLEIARRIDPRNGARRGIRNPDAAIVDRDVDRRVPHGDRRQHIAGVRIDVGDRGAQAVGHPHPTVANRDPRGSPGRIDRLDDRTGLRADPGDGRAAAVRHPDGGPVDRDPRGVGTDRDRVPHGHRLRIDPYHDAAIRQRHPDPSGADGDVAGSRIERDGAGELPAAEVHHGQRVTCDERVRASASQRERRGDRDRRDERQGHQDGHGRMPARRAERGGSLGRFGGSQTSELLRRIALFGDHPEDANRLVESLQVKLTPVDEPDPFHLAGEEDDALTGQDLPRPGSAAESCGEVEGSPAIAALERNRLARVQADADGKGKRRVRFGLFQESLLEHRRGADGLTRRVEDGERFIPPELDHRAAVIVHRLAGDPGETCRELGGGFVAALLREQCVAADVRDQEGPYPGLSADRLVGWFVAQWTSHPLRRLWASGQPTAADALGRRAP